MSAEESPISYISFSDSSMLSDGKLTCEVPESIELDTQGCTAYYGQGLKIGTRCQITLTLGSGLGAPKVKISGEIDQLEKESGKVRVSHVCSKNMALLRKLAWFGALRPLEMCFESNFLAMVEMELQDVGEYYFM